MRDQRYVLSRANRQSVHRMSKRYKGKTCAYCAGVSETADHILAREFVPVPYRSRIPQVPSCKRCNEEKSHLEHYLTTVLLFGGRHADASTNLQNDGPKRLAKNQKLRRELGGGSERIWTQEPSGLVVHALAFPIDGEKVERLVGLVARGLMRHHWSVVLAPDCFVDTCSLTPLGEAHFAQYRSMRAKQRVRGDIGNGALIYEGAQGTDNPQISIWEVALLGGVKMTSVDDADIISRFAVMTGPQSIRHRAERLGRILNPSWNGS